MSEKVFNEKSEVDLAYKILSLSGKDNPIHYKDLILEILDKKNKAVQNEAAAISEIYTMILTEWNPPEVKRTRGTRKTTAKQAAEEDTAIKN